VSWHRQGNSARLGPDVFVSAPGDFCRAPKNNPEVEWLNPEPQDFN
jgi:hypothetical protein